MFWTNIIKTLGKIVVLIGIISAIILGIVAGKIADSGVLGFIVIIIGIAVAFISASGIMMICEMSQNLAEIRKNLEK